MSFWSGPKTILYNKETKDCKYVTVFKDDLMYKEHENLLPFPAFMAQDDNGVYVHKGESLTVSKRTLEKRPYNLSSV